MLQGRHASREAVGDDNNTDPGFDGIILPVYMAEGSP